MYTGIIFAAAAVCAAASMVIGMIWYSPKVFGTIWMRALNMDPNDKVLGDKMKESMPKSMVANIIANFIKALMLFAVLVAFGATAIGPAIVVAVLIAVGFVITTQLSGALWEMQKPSLFWVNAAFTIVEFIVYALILAAWVL